MIGGPLRARLKAETAEAHLRLERTPILSALMRPGFTTDDYGALLAGFYGYFAPLEAALFPAPLPVTPRSPALAEDLGALGVDPAGLARCADLPDAECEPARWGVHYVIEGSQNGARHILAHLAKQPAFAGAPFAFYRSRADWAGFLAALEARFADPQGGEADQVVAAAGRTFDTLHRWLAAVPLSVLDGMSRPNLEHR